MIRFQPVCLASNLIFGCTSCSLIPLYSSSSDSIISKGGNWRYENMYLLLAGKGFNNGIAVEFPLKETSGKVLEDQQNVTWWGQKWSQNWALKSEEGNGAYTLISHSKYVDASCLYANFWLKKRACTVRGKIQPSSQAIWETFPKVKFENWQISLRGGGTSSTITPSTLQKCKVKIQQNKVDEQEFLKFNWTATINCDHASFTKKLTDKNIITGSKIRV